MKKKLYHTMVTHFCQFGGDPIDYWKYADNWDENQKLVAIDFNNRHGFIESHLVKMELVKVYEKREVLTKEIEELEKKLEKSEKIKEAI